jgi:hypothetical protein
MWPWYCWSPQDKSISMSRREKNSKRFARYLYKHYEDLDPSVSKTAARRGTTNQSNLAIITVTPVRK